MNKTVDTPAPERYLVSDDVVRSVCANHLVDAEISRLTTRLNEVSGFPQGRRPKQNDYESLARRRTELLELRRKPTHHTALRDRWFEAVVSEFSDILGPWNVMNLPYFSEGINQTPGTPGTSEEIFTLELYPGGLLYIGQPYSSTSNPLEENWWIHNWTCSAVFPTAPFNGRLFYRFTVESVCNLAQAPVNFGSVKEFVTIGWAANSAMEPLGNWDTVGWPVDVSLPHQGPLFFGTPIPVTGSIAVKSGDNAALGFIYGTIVSVANGYIQFDLCNFNTRRMVPRYRNDEPVDFGKIEYRFEPDWWIKALAQRVQTAA